MNYDASSFEKKKRNKLFLQEKLGLRPDPDAPLAVMVSRFAAHKGFDLVEAALDDIMAQGIQLAVLGTGDRRYEEMFREAAGRYHGRLSAWIAFDTALASQMYAGADIFLMPSLSEPCGLAQMVAMRYGCVPVVRETGGLRDTVPAYNPVTGEGADLPSSITPRQSLSPRSGAVRISAAMTEPDSPRLQSATWRAISAGTSR